MIYYNPVKYWSERIKTHGFVNSTKNAINPIEEQLILKHVPFGSFIMDYGIGDGRMLPVYYKQKYTVQGWDITEYPELNENIKNYPLSIYTFISDDPYRTLPYGDDCFDAVISYSVLTHCNPDNVSKVLNELIRISKILIFSAYDDVPLPINEATYCFLHDYKKLLSDVKIIESHKVNKMRFFVIKKK